VVCASTYVAFVSEKGRRARKNLCETYWKAMREWTQVAVVLLEPPSVLDCLCRTTHFLAFSRIAWL
jgi:hypothetical protein